jgi:exodeoxyribonuclease VII large subunit
MSSKYIFANSDSDSDTEEQPKSWSVSKLTNKIKESLDETFEQLLQVNGEISNYKHSTNRLYFSLKDDYSQIRCVVWDVNKLNNFNNISTSITNGKKVQITGDITVFKSQGSYNITVKSIKLVGEGELHKQYNETKEKYNKLGYFDDKHKKPLPTIINKIGVITAIAGAALQDFIYVIKNNKFSGKVFIKNSIVQGSTAADQVCKSLKELDKLNLDIIIITRGGGSFEDLICFSDPKIIEAVFKAKTCILAAIGHAVDDNLIEHVSDIRAPTPTNAASVVSQNTLSQDTVEIIKNDLHYKIQTRINAVEQSLINIRSKCTPISEITKDNRFQLNQVQKDLLNIIQNRINFTSTGIHNIKYILNKQTTRQNILSQGYIMLSSNDTQITTAKSLKECIPASKEFIISFIDGDVTVQIKV